MVNVVYSLLGVPAKFQSNGQRKKEKMIKLKRIGQGRMTGETVNDQDLLRACGCPLYFWESELDLILWKVGKQDMGLEYPQGE